MNKDFTIQIMNEYGSLNKPFYFLIDFDCNNNFIYNVENYEKSQFKFVIEKNNLDMTNSKSIKFKKIPIDYNIYSIAFNYCLENLKFGNSYLLNLTFPSEIETDFTLEEIFEKSKAKYKVLLKDNFVCFSPETFIKISDGKIYSYPMKGTIDADIPNALEIILNDPKETAEHYTIVDLIRNDLSIVSKKVRVNKFRYADLLITNTKRLYQISSEICGVLPDNYTTKIGDIIFALLPAGSITGAPKVKTVEIIKQAEQYDRKYYTGIAGYFDGKNLDSCVLIRFIEKQQDKYFFKSGGGITVNSNCESEYQELSDKIYVTF